MSLQTPIDMKKLNETLMTTVKITQLITGITSIIGIIIMFYDLIFGVGKILDKIIIPLVASIAIWYLMGIIKQENKPTLQAITRKTPNKTKEEKTTGGVARWEI